MPRVRCFVDWTEDSGMMIQHKAVVVSEVVQGGRQQGVSYISPHRPHPLTHLKGHTGQSGMQTSSNRARQGKGKASGQGMEQGPRHRAGHGRQGKGQGREQGTGQDRAEGRAEHRAEHRALRAGMAGQGRAGQDTAKGRADGQRDKQGTGH